MKVYQKKILLLTSQEISDVLSSLSSTAIHWPAGPARRALELRNRIFEDVLGDDKHQDLRAA
jgi:hypothetical protein